MAAQHPGISVGMPTYNSEQWIGASIESILGQSYGNLELIISDNGSTDGTEEICRGFAAGDTRIKYLRQDTNLGASENYNIVFRAASAPFFKWASSNDICHASFLETCLAEFQRHPGLALCYPRTKLFEDDPHEGVDYVDDLHLLEESPCSRFESLVNRMALNNIMNGVFRREVLSHTPLIKPYFSSDVVLMAEVALRGKIAEVPEFLFFRRMDKETATRLKSEEDLKAHYDPGKRSMMLFQCWRLNLGYLGVALRAPLSADERVCVLGKVLKYFRWNRGDLAAEVWEAARMVVPQRPIR